VNALQAETESVCSLNLVAQCRLLCRSRFCRQQHVFNTYTLATKTAECPVQVVVQHSGSQRGQSAVPSACAQLYTMPPSWRGMSRKYPWRAESFFVCDRCRKNQLGLGPLLRLHKNGVHASVLNLVRVSRDTYRIRSKLLPGTA
jgi:hypothetical protein